MVTKSKIDERKKKRLKSETIMTDFKKMIRLKHRITTFLIAM